MNFWLLKQLRENCRVNEGATALHEKPAVLIWKNIHKRIYKPSFFSFSMFWFIWTILVMCIFKRYGLSQTGYRFWLLRFERQWDFMISETRVQDWVCFLYLLSLSRVMPHHLHSLPNIPELPPPSLTHPQLKGIWISLVPDCSHNKQ